MRLLPKLLVLLVFQLGYSCKKCEDCSFAFFSDEERALLYTNQTQIQFKSDSGTTLNGRIESTISNPESESCGSFPVRPMCNSNGQTSIYLQNENNTTSGIKLYSIQTRKDKNGWECTYFEIGNTFFLTMDKNYVLSSNFGNNDQISTIDNYSFNGKVYNRVQEIIKAPLGNQKELIRALYHPSIGIVELEYTNPNVRYRLVP